MTNILVLYPVEPSKSPPCHSNAVVGYFSVENPTHFNAMLQMAVVYAKKNNFHRPDETQVAALRRELAIMGFKPIPHEILTIEPA